MATRGRLAGAPPLRNCLDEPYKQDNVAEEHGDEA